MKPINMALAEEENERLVLALEKPDEFVASPSEQKWWSLIQELPRGLKDALCLELKGGNTVTNIQKGGWPQKESILACLSDRFRYQYPTNNHFGVTYRQLNDQHYWVEDIHIVVDGTEFLLIA